jgi:hypothetical protein
MGAGGDFIGKPAPDQPHPSPRGIGVPAEGLIGWTVEINIISREFTISASKAAVYKIAMFYGMVLFHKNTPPSFFS